MKRLILVLCICSAMMCSCTLTASETTTSITDSSIRASEEYGSVLYAAAFRKEDVALAQAFDRVLADMIQDGSAAKICENWLNSDLIAYDTSAEYEVSPDDRSLKEAEEKGSIIVGYQDACYPMAFEDAYGNVVGCDADLVHEAARRLGLSVSFEDVEWDNKERKLEREEIDVIFCGYALTEERSQQFTCTRGYLRTSFTLLISQNEQGEKLSDFTNQKIGVRGNSLAAEYLEKNAASNEIIAYSDSSYAYYRMKEGKVSAIFVDTPFALWAMKGKLLKNSK